MSKLCGKVECTRTHTKRYRERYSLRRMSMYHFYSVAYNELGQKTKNLLLFAAQTLNYLYVSFFYFTVVIFSDFQTKKLRFLVDNKQALWEFFYWHLSCTYIVLFPDFFIVNHQSRNHFQNSKKDVKISGRKTQTTIAYILDWLDNSECEIYYTSFMKPLLQ